MDRGSLVEVVAKTLQKSLERREWPADPKAVRDIAEVILEAIDEHAMQQNERLRQLLEEVAERGPNEKLIKLMRRKPIWRE